MSYKHFLLLAVAALVLSGVVQRQVERRRVAENLVWTAPENKTALETGFLALGGFRGLLVDVLWLRAIRLQDSAKYYELKLLGDLIQELQPAFPHIHAFLAWNMSYNLARRANSPADKWYWIRSGLAMLEKGLERNQHNYLLWFELGLQYADRLGDNKIGSCLELRQKELPNIDELNEEQRMSVFLKNPRTSGKARDNESVRWAAYYFFKATNALGDPLPIRSERMFGNCLDRLGHWANKDNKTPEQCKNWDDWGSESWWVNLRKKYQEKEQWQMLSTLDHNLRYCILMQMDHFDQQAAKDTDPEVATTFERKAREAYERLKGYFPGEKRGAAELLDKYRKEMAAHAMLKPGN